MNVSTAIAPIATAQDVQPAETAKSGKPSRVLRVTGKLKTALDAIVWDGKPWEAAAVEAGLTTRAMRLALEKSHVIRYLREQKHVFRASASGANIHRAIELRDQDENKLASLQAIKFLEGEENKPAAVTPGRNVTPGICVIINANRERPQLDHQALIEINPLISNETVPNET